MAPSGSGRPKAPSAVSPRPQPNLLNATDGRGLRTGTPEVLPGFQPALQAVRFVTFSPQLLRGRRAGVPTVAEGDQRRALRQPQPLHGPLVASLQGVVDVEVHAPGYRSLPVLFPPADVHDRDPLSALQHALQGPRVDVVPLRHYRAPRSLATP